MDTSGEFSDKTAQARLRSGRTEGPTVTTASTASTAAIASTASDAAAGDDAEHGCPTRVPPCTNTPHDSFLQKPFHERLEPA